MREQRKERVLRGEHELKEKKEGNRREKQQKSKQRGLTNTRRQDGTPSGLKSPDSSRSSPFKYKYILPSLII